MVGLPSPRDDVHRSLRVPDIREGTFSPLANAPLPACPEDCNSPGLATQRLPRSGLSDMSQTRLPPCGDASSSASHNDCRAAPAVQRQHETKRGATNRDAVQLADRAGIPATLIIAAGGLAVASILTRHWRLPAQGTADDRPSLHWPAPVVVG